MPLSDLTSREAVLEALKEFDTIGREQFLKKYGFRSSRSYFLEQDGKLYDSKAIVGAAFSFQYPHRGPMTSNDFKGGEVTTARRLEQLGFHIHRKPSSVHPITEQEDTYTYEYNGDDNKELELPPNEEISRPRDEDALIALAVTRKCKMDQFDILLSRFLNFSRTSKLDIDLSTAVDVLAATLSSQFLLFAGPSGTGKSSLARLLARFFTMDDAWYILETRRQWIGPEDVFGYYSPLTGYYALTPNTAGMIKLHQSSLSWSRLEIEAEEPNVSIPILIIEEANLSPIEGYLAPVIHGISSPSTPYVKVPLHAKQLGANDPEKSYIIPCNMLLGPFPRFLGTINVDATSQAPARKVSARSSIILLEPEERFDSIAAATFLSTIAAADSTNELPLLSGLGRLWIGNPASARLMLSKEEIMDFTGSLALLLNSITNSVVKISDEDNEEVLSISRRDLERCVNYMAYFVHLAEVASIPKMNRTMLLALAAENALLHMILPNLPADNFRTCVAALLESNTLVEPSTDPNQLGGLLHPRLKRLQASANGLVFAEALDFWACLS